MADGLSISFREHHSGGATPAWPYSGRPDHALVWHYGGGLPVGSRAQPELDFDGIYCRLGHVHLVDSHRRAELDIHRKICADSNLESWLCPLPKVYPR